MRGIISPVSRCALLRCCKGSSSNYASSRLQDPSRRDYRVELAAFFIQANSEGYIAAAWILLVD